MSDSATFKLAIANFKPEFGNANHIAALALIEDAARCQARVDKVKPGRKTVCQLVNVLLNLLNIGFRIFRLVRFEVIEQHEVGTLILE
jgi:hypothetical protein